MSDIFKVSEDVKPTTTIDVKGLNCPLPLILTKKNISKLSVGDILLILGMLPNFRIELQRWCERNNHIYLGEKEISGQTNFFIKKG